MAGADAGQRWSCSVLKVRLNRLLSRCVRRVAYRTLERTGQPRAFADRFGRRIYGIEPGNDGNRLVRTMIERDAFGLGEWRLVESSEPGMLTQVARVERAGVRATAL